MKSLVDIPENNRQLKIDNQLDKIEEFLQPVTAKQVFSDIFDSDVTAARKHIKQLDDVHLKKLKQAARGVLESLENTQPIAA